MVDLELCRLCVISSVLDCYGGCYHFIDNPVTMYIPQGYIDCKEGYTGISNHEEIVTSAFLFSQLLSALSYEHTAFSHSPSFHFT